MEESPELEKLPRIITDVLKIVLCTALIALAIVLAIVLIIALVKITYTLSMMVLNTSSVVPYDVAEQAVMFFLYFGFIGLIVQYFKSGYHFSLRYFIYAGITAMLRLIIVNHESSVDTILFAGAILIMVIALCLVLYSNKLKNI
ncbi:phosphate-starvation-inducible protein PsiE [Haemophilus influenzae]|uniref:phosphate-starvation-inducible protein PsiE n=2 Tax=Haemophilus influenzae TaxID=727 RepID=UPI000E354E4D|nr:phosphate-starvation-inducible protein PsiE [Haemophilus influenzae]MCK9643397.1 phosphate-starvation-inducible protein PsiE [Haemophilus influenzae]